MYGAIFQASQNRKASFGEYFHRGRFRPPVVYIVDAQIRIRYIEMLDSSQDTSIVQGALDQSG